MIPALAYYIQPGRTIFTIMITLLVNWVYFDSGLHPGVYRGS